MGNDNQNTNFWQRLPLWVWGLLPLVLLLLVVSLFFLANPLAFFTGNFPPLETLTIQQIRFPGQNQVELTAINGGPDPVSIAQVIVDDAYWQFNIEPATPLGRLQQATITMNYPWVDGEPLTIALITDTGATFASEVPVAVASPGVDLTTFIVFGLLGIYVGIIPVGLGTLCF
ncbi:MAG: hypothetical protein KDE28_17295, partial [Anaerolineales bacterium]|nr:hypothetical protein [Anaerolineales bacterium]